MLASPVPPKKWNYGEDRAHFFGALGQTCRTGHWPQSAWFPLSLYFCWAYKEIKHSEARWQGGSVYIGGGCIYKPFLSHLLGQNGFLINFPPGNQTPDLTTTTTTTILFFCCEFINNFFKLRQILKIKSFPLIYFVLFHMQWFQTFDKV